MRAPNMQRLTDQVKAARPGVVIGGIGDEAHKLKVSGHNEDDTPGVRAEDQDADNTPEHRALDFMIGTAFTPEDAEALYDDLGTKSTNQRRLLYVIYNRRKRSRSTGWQEVPYNDGGEHDNHVHASGEADDDANTADWDISSLAPSTNPGGEDMWVVRKGDANEGVRLLQRRLVRQGVHVGPPDQVAPADDPYKWCDGKYGDWTTRANKEFFGGDGTAYDKTEQWERLNDAETPDIGNMAVSVSGTVSVSGSGTVSGTTRPKN